MRTDDFYLSLIEGIPEEEDRKKKNVVESLLPPPSPPSEVDDFYLDLIEATPKPELPSGVTVEPSAIQVGDLGEVDTRVKGLAEAAKPKTTVLNIDVGPVRESISKFTASLGKTFAGAYTPKKRAYWTARLINAQYTLDSVKATKKVLEEMAEEAPWAELDDTTTGQIANTMARVILGGGARVFATLGKVFDVPRQLLLIPFKGLAKIRGVNPNKEGWFRKAFFEGEDAPLHSFDKFLTLTGVIAAWTAHKLGFSVEKVQKVWENTAKARKNWVPHIVENFILDPIMWFGVGEAGALKTAKPLLSSLYALKEDSQAIRILNKALKKASTPQEFIEFATEAASKAEGKTAGVLSHSLNFFTYMTDEQFKALKELLPHGGFHVLRMPKATLVEKGLYGARIGDIPLKPAFMRKISTRISKAIRNGIDAILPEAGRFLKARAKRPWAELIRPEPAKIEKLLRQSKELGAFLDSLDKDTRKIFLAGMTRAAETLGKLDTMASLDTFRLMAKIADAHREMVKFFKENFMKFEEGRVKPLVKKAEEAFAFYIERPEVSKFIASKILGLDNEAVRQLFTNKEFQRRFKLSLLEEAGRQGLDYPLFQELKAWASRPEGTPESLEKILNKVPIFDGPTARFISSDKAEEIASYFRGVFNKIAEVENFPYSRYIPIEHYLPHKFDWKTTSKLVKDADFREKFFKRITQISNGFMKRRVLVFPTNPKNPQLFEGLRKLRDLGLNIPETAIEDIKNTPWDKAFNKVSRIISTALADFQGRREAMDAIYAQLAKMERDGLIYFPSIHEVAKHFGAKIIETDPFKLAQIRISAARQAFMRSRLIGVVRNALKKFPDLVPDERFMRKYLVEKGLEAPADREALREAFLAATDAYKKSDWLFPGKVVFAPLEDFNKGGAGLIDRVFSPLMPLFEDHRVRTWFLDKLWRPGTILWKAGVTVPWLGFHIRNFITNQTFLMLEGMKPWDPDFYKALPLSWVGMANYLKDPTLLKEPLRHLNPAKIKVLENKTLLDLLEEARRMGVLEGFIRGELGFGGEWASHILEKRPMIKLGGKVAEFVEGGSRLQGYLYWRMKGFSPEAAVEKVNKALFNYKRPGPLIEKMRDTVFPFATFYMKAMPFLLEKVMKNPRIWIGYTKLRQLALKKSGFIPGVMGDYSGREILPLYTKKQGDETVIIAAPMTGWNPLGPLVQMLDFTNTMVSLAHPALRLAIEEALNKTFYAQKPIERYPGELKPIYIPFIGDVLLPAKLRYAVSSLFRGPREFYRLHRIFYPLETFQTNQTAGDRLANLLKTIFGLNTLIINPAQNIKYTRTKIKRVYIADIQRTIKINQRKIKELEKALREARIKYGKDSPQAKEIESEIWLYKQVIQRAKERIKDTNEYIRLLERVYHAWKITH